MTSHVCSLRTFIVAALSFAVLASGCGGDSATGNASADGSVPEPVEDSDPTVSATDAPDTDGEDETAETTVASGWDANPVPLPVPNDPDSPGAMDDGILRPGESGPEVRMLQWRLTTLGFRPGEIDGNYGATTSQAVLAFQKHEGIGRDGAAGPKTLAVIAAPRGAGPRPGLPVPRVEIDLARQVLFVVTPLGTQIFNTSTGNGEPYENPETGARAIATTPTGSFSVQHRVDGIDKGPLGDLYRPLYFVGGYAVHGSHNVPGYPASHGCARVSNADQDWIWDNVSNGTPVIIY